MARRIKYTKGEVIVGLIFIAVIFIIKNPVIILYILGALSFIGFMYYLWTFNKYSRNFLRLKDHLFILSLVKYWKTRNKVILGIGMFFVISYINETLNNSYFMVFYALLFAGTLIYFIIFGIRTLLRKLNDLIRKNTPVIPLVTIEDVDKMSGTEFEHFLLSIYLSQGYYGEVTGPSGDFGADLVLRSFKEVVVIQAKCYGDGRKVGVSAVNEVFGGAGFYNANKKIVITNRTYTEPARASAKRNGVILLDRDDLRELINHYNYNEVKVKLAKQYKKGGRVVSHPLSM